jgi:hypothetical protein
MDDVINETTPAKYTFHRCRLLGCRNIGYNNTSRIRKRARNPVKAREGNDRIADAADPEYDDRFHGQTLIADALIFLRAAIEIGDAVPKIQLASSRCGHLVGPAPRPGASWLRKLRHPPPPLQAIVLLQPFIDRRAETRLGPLQSVRR